MEIINNKLIEKFFSFINDSGISYVLIKNVRNELPNKLPNGKDIDLVVLEADREKFEEAMLREGFCRVVPPLGIENGYEFLYGLREYQFWKLDDEEVDFYVDASFLLSCKGLLPKTWIPLDRMIQERVWKERVWDDENNWWILDVETRFVYYLVRCIFDKQVFSPKYIREIENSYLEIDLNIVRELLKTVFFKYTDRLLQLVEDRNYEIIREDYISFRDY